MTITVDGEVDPEMQTMARVHWTVEIEEPGVALEDTYLEFGVEGAYDRTRDGQWLDDGSFEAFLHGLVPAEDHQVRAVVLVDGTPYASESITLTAGAANNGLPGLTVGGDGDDADADAGGYLLTSILTHPSTAVVMDTHGNYVWWYQPDQDQELIPRAHISRAGDSVIMMLWDSAPNAPDTAVPRLLEVGFDGREIRDLPLPGAHHDFVELPDGTLAVILQDVREVDGRQVIGDTIREISPNGDEVEVWSAWDELTFDTFLQVPPEGDIDWTHANAIDYDEVRDVYHLSLHGLPSIVEIDRASGELNWVMGGMESDFVSDTGGFIPLDGQHQFQVLGDRILVFNNGVYMTGYSEAVEWQLDPEAGTVEVVWSYCSTPPLLSFTMGDASRMEGGDTLITWATAGRIDRVTPEGEIAWSVGGALGGGFGYTTWFAEWPEGS